MSRIVRRAALLGAACCAVVLGSCGNPREERLPETGATLEGVVKYGNEQIRFAQIQVLGGGKMATGRIEEDGRYKVENCPLGEVKIGVNTAAAMGEFQSAVRQKQNVRFVAVNEKYADPEKSGIKTTVNGGANTYDIVIPR
jgi:hypothetical protein